jgi:DHA3 family macrolide efflux protein-like MFS transporter
LAREESRKDATSKRSSPLHVLKNHNFARLFFAGATSTGGQSLGLVALTWLVYVQTGSAVDVAYLALASIVASIALSLVAGTLVDRQNRRLLMILADLIRAGSLAILAAVLSFRGFDLVLIIAVSFILGSFSTLFYPAERALMPTLITREEVQDANGLVMVTNSVFQAVASGIGGALIALLGAVVAIGLNSATFAVSGVLIASIITGRSIWKGPETGFVAKNSFLSDTAEGVRFLVKWRGLLYLTLSAGIENFFYTMITTFVVVYAAQVLHGGAIIYGTVLALLALGFGLGAVLVGRTNAVKSAGLVWGLSSLASGLAALSLAFAPNEYVAYASVLAMGIISGYGNATWLSVVQLIVPTEMQGRYFGVDQLGSFAVIPLGQVVGAFLIEATGVQTEYVVAAVGVVISAALFLLSKELRELRYVHADPALN